MARDWCIGRSEAEWLVDLIESQDEYLNLADELREMFGMNPRCEDNAHDFHPAMTAGMLNCHNCGMMRVADNGSV